MYRMFDASESKLNLKINFYEHTHRQTDQHTVSDRQIVYSHTDRQTKSKNC